MAVGGELVDVVGPQFRALCVPMLVIFMLKKENGIKLCLGLLQIFRGKTWIFLIASKLHEKFMKYGILIGQKFEEGEIAFFTARRTLLWDYYNALSVTIGLFYAYKYMAQDRELRLRILQSLICGQIAYICLVIHDVVVAFQVVVLATLIIVYTEEVNPNDFSAVVKTLVPAAGKGLLYAVLMSVIFGVILLGMADGNASVGVETL